MKILRQIGAIALLALKFAALFEAALLFATLMTIMLADNEMSIIAAAVGQISAKPLLWAWWMLRSVAAAWLFCFIAISTFKALGVAVGGAGRLASRLVSRKRPWAVKQDTAEQNDATEFGEKQS